MSQDENKEIDNIISSFIGMFVISAIVIFISYCIGLPETLFGQYDESGNLIKTNNINGEFIKLIGLFVGGSIAFWGLWINNKRVKIQNKQIELQTEQIVLQREAQEKVAEQIKIAEKAQENVIKQIQIAEKAQINTRFKDAAQLLASTDTSAILSGTYALHQIAVECSKLEDESYKGYVKVINEILCAYVRENWRKPKEEGEVIEYKPTILLQTIIDLLFQNKDNLYKDYYSNLSETNLCNVTFFAASLSNVGFEDAILSNVYFRCSTLSKVYFRHATLSDVKFEDTTLRNVVFRHACLDGMKFIGADFYSTDFIFATLSDLFFWDNTMSEVDFTGTTLNDVKFSRTTLFKVSFFGATLNEVDFAETILEGYSKEEITRPGRSNELTSPQAVAAWEEKKRKEEEQASL